LGGTGLKAAGLIAYLLLAGCDGLSEGDRVSSCVQSTHVTTPPDPESGDHSLVLKVMTYNVEGLPPEFHGDRSQDLARIQQSFNAMIANGSAPDIVVVQEMFTDDAIAKLRAIKYPNFSYGPLRRDIPEPLPAVRFADYAIAAPNIRMQPSGLAIFSRYPIKTVRKRAFGYTSCSGADCFANKGMMIAQIAIPGMPVPLQVATTHMNAQDASGMPERLHLNAHHQQSKELRDFLSDFDNQAPMIIAGDFNMRASPARFARFTSLIPHKSAHHYCHYNRNLCRSSVPLKSAAPWLTTQDLQFYKDGASAKLRPVELSNWFNAPNRGGKLSDHDAQLVHWKLSWPIHTRPISGSCDFKGIPSLKELLG
jgi:endonuclease/exonuclease/phosphatase family metal-dependent hydrolase